MAQAMTTSNFLRLAFLSMASRPGRWSLPPAFSALKTQSALRAVSAPAKKFRTPLQPMQGLLRSARTSGVKV